MDSAESKIHTKNLAISRGGGRHISYQRTKIRISSDFLLKTMHESTQENNILSMMKGKKKKLSIKNVISRSSHRGAVVNEYN